MIMNFLERKFWGGLIDLLIQQGNQCPPAIACNLATVELQVDLMSEPLEAREAGLLFATRGKVLILHQRTTKGRLQFPELLTFSSGEPCANLELRP